MLFFSQILPDYICPSLGCIMASVMFAAPVTDLRKALITGSLGALNPFPWVVMTGNCLGWTVYGYYTRDPFIVAANLPGFVLSLWLNMGAAKLQYFEINTCRKGVTDSVELGPAVPLQSGEHWDASPAIMEDALTRDSSVLAAVSRSVSRDGSAGGTYPSASKLLNAQEELVMVPQERSMMLILMAWAVVLVWVGWFLSPRQAQPSTVIGVVVNINLVFFYGAPLQTIQQVLQTRSSETIHVPTMIMNWTNTSFWIAYGISRKDMVIVLPNALGLILGLAQGVLCLLFPHQRPTGMEPVPQDVSDHDEDEANGVSHMD